MTELSCHADKKIHFFKVKLILFCPYVSAPLIALSALIARGYFKVSKLLGLTKSLMKNHPLQNTNGIKIFYRSLHLPTPSKPFTRTYSIHLCFSQVILIAMINLSIVFTG